MAPIHPRVELDGGRGCQPPLPRPRLPWPRTAMSSSSGRYLEIAAGHPQASSSQASLSTHRHNKPLPTTPPGFVHEHAPRSAPSSSDLAPSSAQWRGSGIRLSADVNAFPAKPISISPGLTPSSADVRIPPRSARETRFRADHEVLASGRRPSTLAQLCFIFGVRTAPSRPRASSLSHR